MNIFLVLTIPFFAQSYDFMQNNLYYKIGPNNSVSIVCPRYYNDYDHDYIPNHYHQSSQLVIPDSVWYNNQFYTVNTISSYAFLQCGNISGKVVIPSTVTSIGYAAFAGTNIDSLIIGDNVGRINSELFLCNDPVALPKNRTG